MIADHAQDLLRKFAALAAPTMFIIGSQQITASAKNMWVIRPSTAVLATSLFAAAGLGFGLGALPAYGKSAIIGAYIAEAWVNTAIYSLFLKFSAKTAGFTFLDKQHFNTTNLKDFLKVGMWPSATIFAELMLGFSVTTLSSKFGTEAQASVGYTYQSLWLNTFLAVKLALASMIQLGYVKGELEGTTNIPAARKLLFKTGIQGVITTVAICTIIPTIFVSNPDIMLSIFGKPNAAIEANIRKTAPYFAAGFTLDALSFAALFQARMLGDHVISGGFRVVSFIFGAAMSALLSITFNMGIEGLAIGYMMGMAASAILVSTRFYNALNNTFKLPETESLLGNNQNNTIQEQPSAQAEISSDAGDDQIVEIVTHDGQNSSETQPSPTSKNNTTPKQQSLNHKTTRNMIFNLGPSSEKSATKEESTSDTLYQAYV